MFNVYAAIAGIMGGGEVGGGGEGDFFVIHQIDNFLQPVYMQ